MPGQFELLLHDVKAVNKADDGAQVARFWGVAATGGLDRQNEKIAQKAIDSFKTDFIGKPLCIGTHADARVNPLLQIGIIDKCGGEGDVLEIEGYFEKLHPYYPMIEKALSNEEWPVDWKLSIGGKIINGGRHMTWDGGKAVSVIEEMGADHVLLCRSDAAVNQDTMFAQAGKAEDATLADVVFKAGADIEAIDLTGKADADSENSPSVSEGINKSEEGDDMGVIEKICELLEGVDDAEKTEDTPEVVVVEKTELDLAWDTLRTSLEGIVADSSVDKAASATEAIGVFTATVFEKLGIVVEKTEDPVPAEEVAEKTEDADVTEDPAPEDVAEKADAGAVTVDAFRALLDEQASKIGTQISELVTRVSAVEETATVLGKAVAPVADAIGKASGSDQVEPEPKQEVRKSGLMWGDANPLAKDSLEKNTEVLYG